MIGLKEPNKQVQKVRMEEREGFDPMSKDELPRNDEEISVSEEGKKKEEKRKMRK